MSITIHHGPNGSFKTSGVIQDYFIKAALEGRHVVTNIRGVSRERAMLNLPDASEKFDVTFIDTETREGRYLIATWFHWVPPGALLLFDEAGVMFPKVWKPADIAKLAFPGGIDAASEVDRPAVWSEAWEMHRHWNWDIVLSVPHIKLVREDIRLTTEGAFKHKNKALLGPLFKGYKEGYHNAQKNGESVSDFDVIRDKRIDDIVFRLYDSTKTGKAQGTLNGFNLFTSPRLLFALGIAVLAFGYAILSGGYGILFDKAKPLEEVVVVAPVPVPVVKKAVTIDNFDPQVDSFESLAASFDAAGDDVDDEPRSSVDSVKAVDSIQSGILSNGPLSGLTLRIAAGIKSAQKYIYMFELLRGDSVTAIRGDTLESMGYVVEGSSPCLATVSFESIESQIICFYFDDVAMR